MCDLLNSDFLVPKYAGGGNQEDLTPFLEPLPTCGSVVHPVDACNLRCREIAKAKHAECKMKIKQFTAFMKTQGCPGTWCSTKKKSQCPNRAKSKKSGRGRR
jgi:hypothetical protein